MKKEIIERILAETEKGYDMVADKFSETRNHFWPDLKFIKDYAKTGDKVLDFGSGNSRILELFSDKPIEYIGADISQNLVNIASKKFAGNVKFMKITSCNNLPFPEDYFNVVYAIAVFHHIPSRELRLKMATELHRVTKPGGHIIVTAWNLWQLEHIGKIIKNWMRKIFGASPPPHQFKGDYAKNSFIKKIKCKLIKLLFGENWCGGEDWNDCYIPFEKDNKNIFQRYHHAFGKNELKKIFSEAGFTAENCEIINNKNIVFVGKK